MAPCLGAGTIPRRVLRLPPAGCPKAGHESSPCPFPSSRPSQDSDCPLVLYRDIQKLCPGSGPARPSTEIGAGDLVLENTDTSLSQPGTYHAFFSALASVSDSPPASFLEDPAHSPGCPPASAFKGLAAKARSQSPCPTLMQRY